MALGALILFSNCSKESEKRISNNVDLVLAL